MLYYKSIRFISLLTGDRINVNFTKMNLNPGINPERDFSLVVPKNTEIIRIH